MKREMIKIDEEKCNGCGLCIPNCHEGALQVIDGKVRLVSDLMCDGLGACLGHCPEGALSIEEREAEPYDETKVMEIMVTKGVNTVIAHLSHLKDHGETAYLQEGLSYIIKNESSLDFTLEEVQKAVHSSSEGSCGSGGCPGTVAKSIAVKEELTAAVDQPSTLTHWPVQMHLINPKASYFKNTDLLLAADCTAFALGDFHSKQLKNKTLAIACPKLDSGQESYMQKLISLIDDATINTLTVMMMEVPCCSGLIRMAQHAVGLAKRNIPIKAITVSIEGKILNEQWM